MNSQLVEHGGRLLKNCSTAPVYKFYDITKEGDPFRRPGLVRVVSGVSIEAEGTECQTLLMVISVVDTCRQVRLFHAQLEISCVYWLG